MKFTIGTMSVCISYNIEFPSQTLRATWTRQQGLQFPSAARHFQAHVCLICHTIYPVIFIVGEIFVVKSPHSGLVWHQFRISVLVANQDIHKSSPSSGLAGAPLAVNSTAAPIIKWAIA